MHRRCAGQRIWIPCPNGFLLVRLWHYPKSDGSWNNVLFVLCGRLRLFEFEEGVVGWTSIFVVFAVADGGCVSLFDKLVGDVFPVERDGGSVTSTESLTGGFRVIDLNVDLLLALFHPGPTVFPMSRFRRYSLTSTCQVACLGSLVLR